MPLPNFPRLALRCVEALPSRDEPGFLHLQRRVLRVEFDDGTLSEPFVYDAVGRERLDAVVIAPYFRDVRGDMQVYLRSALRPPAAARPEAAWPVPERATLGHLWELPAGLVEVGERSVDGLRRCAARELHEEVGFDMAPEAFAELGPPSFPAPGIIAERHFYFHVEVDPERRVRPIEDGSPLERGAAVIAVALHEALELVRHGEIEDAKTEIGLRRLRELG
ncbi:NUDIX hydrolase [Chondromyces crocatus]|uniref:ADP-ribose pyrophosphatase n=1 Tax=Chondromyces crocatus TaxID=52 RepID=A0A0K1E6H8_CHOCO|nr:NUDIX hydrolase [Chondromyces crocatus]AKT36486.1 ADP-ribose pyrophosphatase [Chondromyces crocatus]